MNMKDKLFIFLSIILVTLFAIRISENISSNPLFERSLNRPVEVKSNTDEILIRLEEAGLEPREAKYYE